MSSNLHAISLVISILVIILILSIVKKRKISVKYSLTWLFSFFLLLLFTIFPGFLTWTTNILGIQVSSNMIFMFLIIVLIAVSISLTMIVSSQDKKITLLIQEVSILKAEIKKQDK